MKVRDWLLLTAAVALLGWVLWRDGYTRGEEQARYLARTDTLRVQIARLDTVYRADTVRLWRTLRVIDTLVRVDSIPVIAADSARADTSLRVLHAGLRSCASALTTCEQRVTLERRLRVVAESAAAARASPPPRHPARGFVAGALTGAVTVLLLRR